MVTANPEILMHAGDSPEIRALLLDEETAVVPDGISVVKAMRLLGLPAKERITGVDLAEQLLKLARGSREKASTCWALRRRWSPPWPKS